MRNYLPLFTLLLLCFTGAQAQQPQENGLVQVKSNHGVDITADRLEAAIKEKGLTFFTRFKHAENAANNGLELRPTQVLVFGNPKLGTPLMHCAQTVALDLPQKVLIYEDASGTVWLTYNDPDYLARRHNISSACKEQLAKIKGALDKLTHLAAAP